MHPIGSVSMLSVIASQEGKRSSQTRGLRLRLSLDCFALLAVAEEAQCVSSTLKVAINTREHHHVLTAPSAHELTDNSLSKNLNSCYVHNSRLPDGSSAMNTPVP